MCVKILLLFSSNFIVKLKVFCMLTFIVSVRKPFLLYDRKKDVLNSSLKSLCISAKIAHALKKRGYRTVMDIVETPSKQTVRLWNIGEVSIKELASRFREKSFKMLFGFLLERISLSRRNNWIDELNRVYIVHSVSH